MIELHIQQVPSANLEELTTVLEQYGALAISLVDAANQPILEPPIGETPLWSQVQVQALFETCDEHFLLCEKLLQTLYPQYSIKRYVVEDQVWELSWEKTSQPICFGKRLWICPSHHSVTHPEAMIIKLDPGLAFGTGSHPTTALCLQWLDQHDLPGKTVIDFGCGSGILMIAALKLGAHFAYGVDIDPQALTATRENAEKNTIPSDQYQLLGIGASEQIHNDSDIILANILLNPLLSLKSTFSKRLKKEGVLVISGILTEQVPLLLEAYLSHFEWVKTETLEEWALVVLKPVSSSSKK